MADIEFICPHCQQSLEAPEDMAGETVECPSCGKPVTIGAPVEADEVRENACPECGETMAPDAVLCVKCGFHKGLGKKIGTEIG